MAKKKAFEETASTEATASLAKTTSFRVLSNLHHDGKLYRKGGTVSLTVTAARHLLKSKTVQAIEAVEESK